MTPLSLRLFGSFDLQAEESRVVNCSRPIQELLTLLVLRHDRSVDRTWLAETLWPTASLDRARFYLRRNLTELRTALGTQRHRLLSPTISTLRLDLFGAECDLLAFDACITSNVPSTLEKAVSLYSGPLLEACDAPWILVERETRAAGVLQALESLACYKQEQGDSGEAARLLHRIITMEPLHEAGYCRLMEALAASGDFAGVEQQYRQLRLVLRNALNTEPASATTALYQRLCHSGQTPQTTLPATPTASPTRHLPCPLTALIGRTQERHEILQAKSRTRLLTLTGIGGVGKTRLAIAVAEDSEAAYPDGVWFVDLSTLQDPTLVPQTVARTLGVRSSPDLTFEETLLQVLGPKRLLLVMDNCEHLIEECARWVKQILQESPEVHILCTSRQPLQIAGETVWPVEPLPVPPPEEPGFGKDGRAGELRYYDSVALLLNRATTAAQHFRLTSRNAGAIVWICRSLDGIPLAIELAAARLRSLSVQEIAARLEDRFQLLTTGDRTLPRHQTLLAAMDWSYDLLTAPERTCLRQISVFAGGCTLDAAEAITGTALDPLTSLVEKSLVVYEESENGQGRYRLLETVREYAQEKLRDGGEQDAVRLRHRDYFLALAEEAEPHLDAGQQTAWFRRLDEEHENLRAALDRSLQETGATKGLRLCSALWRFWLFRGHYAEGLSWSARSLQKTEARERTLERAKVLSTAGSLADHLGEYASARNYHEEALSIRTELGDKSGIASSLNKLGIVANARGDYASAQTYFEESLAIAREIGSRSDICGVLGNLGDLARVQGDLALAQACYDECLIVSREVGNRANIGATLHSLGNVSQARGDYHVARAYFEESLSIFREIGHRQFMSNALGGLSSIAYHLEDDIAARTYLEECLIIFREIGNRIGLATSLEMLGSLAAVQEQLERACQLFGAAEALRESIGAPRPANERAEQEEMTAQIRGLMREEAFSAAWAAGRAMSLEQAIEFAQSNPL